MENTLITALCGAALIDDANQLARCIRRSEDDEATYALNMTDGKNEYALVSTFVSPQWIGAASKALKEQEWGCDVKAAQRAQAALVVWNGVGDAPMPNPDKLTVLIGVDASTTVGLWGVTAIADKSGK